MTHIVPNIDKGRLLLILRRTQVEDIVSVLLVYVIRNIGQKSPSH